MRPTLTTSSEGEVQMTEEADFPVPPRDSGNAIDARQRATASGAHPGSDPRFDDAQVAEILTIATRVGAAGDVEGTVAGSPAGLTLSELRSIASEAGIPPSRIDAAAAELLAREAQPSPIGFLGTPRSVARIVPISGPLDDPAWNRLVAHLRATFNAQGQLMVEGPIRSWRNGNLQVHVEPDPSGAAPWRLRMQTLKGNVPGLAGLGVAGIALGGLSIMLGLIGGADPEAVVIGSAFLAAGGGQLAWLRAKLPPWASRRRAQMDQIAAAVTAALAGPEPDTEPDSD